MNIQKKASGPFTALILFICFLMYVVGSMMAKVSESEPPQKPHDLTLN